MRCGSGRHEVPSGFRPRSLHPGQGLPPQHSAAPIISMWGGKVRRGYHQLVQTILRRLDCWRWLNPCPSKEAGLLLISASIPRNVALQDTLKWRVCMLLLPCNCCDHPPPTSWWIDLRTGCSAGFQCSMHGLRFDCVSKKKVKPVLTSLLGVDNSKNPQKIIRYSIYIYKYR